MINHKQHGSLLQDFVSEGNPKLRDPFPMNIAGMDNHFELHDTFIKTMNNLSWKYENVEEDTRSLRQGLQNIYPLPKLLVKMNLKKLLAARRIVVVHAWLGRSVRLKSA